MGQNGTKWDSLRGFSSMRTPLNLTVEAEFLRSGVVGKKYLERPTGGNGMDCSSDLGWRACKARPAKSQPHRATRSASPRFNSLSFLRSSGRSRRLSSLDQRPFFSATRIEVMPFVLLQASSKLASFARFRLLLLRSRPVDDGEKGIRIAIRGRSGDSY